MNIYRFSFNATCPVDGRSINYQGEIRTTKVIKAESISERLVSFDRALHEDIADKLHQLFGGTQRIFAAHAGITIETLRGELQC